MRRARSRQSLAWLLSLVARALVILIAVYVATLVYGDLRVFPRTEDAAVRANIAGVAAQVSGSIVRIAVADNQWVREGDVLFEIDDRPYRAEADRARARLALIRQEVAALRDGITEAEAAVREIEAREQYARKYYERLVPLLDGRFVSEDRLEKARAEAESLAASVARGVAAVARTRSELGEADGKNTRIEEAEAALADAELRVSYCTVRAPRDGLVTNLQIAPGSYAAAGEQVFSLVDTSAWYVLANFRETDLARIRPGQVARIFLMGDRTRPLTGRVEGIASAVLPLDGVSRGIAGSGGVLSNVSPTFDFIQLATRFPVRIVVDASDSSALRMGGKAAVVIDTSDAD